MYDLAHTYEETSHMRKMMNNVKHYKLQRIEDKPTLAWEQKGEGGNKYRIIKELTYMGGK